MNLEIRRISIQSLKGKQKGRGGGGTGLKNASVIAYIGDCGPGTTAKRKKRHVTWLEGKIYSDSVRLVGTDRRFDRKREALGSGSPKGASQRGSPGQWTGSQGGKKPRF